jgi:hypothetical protein
MEVAVCSCVGKVVRGGVRADTRVRMVLSPWCTRVRMLLSPWLSDLGFPFVVLGLVRVLRELP